jgi:hypothetical protein
MNAMTSGSSSSHCYQLRFRSLRRADWAVAFPCDAGGRVDIDALSEQARNDYFFARTVIGREFGAPQVTLDD